jgi:hypothetical protein
MALIRGHHSFDDHFSQIPNAWLRDGRVSLEARGLLAQIMSHRPGWNLSINSISHQNAVGRDKVRRILDELIGAGYLERSENQAHNDKGHLAGYDYVTCDPSALAQEPSKAEPHKAEPTKATEPPKNTIPKEHYLERTPILKNGEIGSDSGEMFEQFWEAYPKKADKRVAEQAFVKALKRTNLDTLMAGVLQYSLDPARKPEFTKNPATWLNADAWANAPLVAPEPLNDWGKPFGKPAESPRQREWVRASHDRGEHWECRPGEFDHSASQAGGGNPGAV